MSDKQVKRETKMVQWRGCGIEFGVGQIEFADMGRHAKPPWYVIRIASLPKDPNPTWRKPWYWWLDYNGPPQVFLTRKRAAEKAAQLRKQYNCSARVVRLTVEDAGHE